jgi:hypothetical protein
MKANDDLNLAREINNARNILVGQRDAAMRQVVDLENHRKAVVTALSDFFNYTPTGQSAFLNAWGWYNGQIMLASELHITGVLDDWEFKMLKEKLRAQRPNLRWSEHKGWDAQLKRLADQRGGPRKLRITEFERD